MKILHTADWHIGKILHKQSLASEMQLFLEWLLDLIRSESIDVLLVSGDIFDIANPSVKDREVYYRFLSRLIDTGVQVIITGGNHDSVGLIDAPQEILGHLNINVIGGVKEDLKQELIEIKDDKGTVQLVVAAVPFLRDKDLRKMGGDNENDSRAEALKKGIAKHYSDLSNLCNELYPKVPAIAMGHLYAHGVSSSDSERDIYLGNSVAVTTEAFTHRFGYVALGHIHRPQVIGGNEMIRYSGSPIPLSFSERKDQKCVLITELDNGKFVVPKTVIVPASRQLKRIKGNVHEVRKALKEYEPDFPLKSFVELDIEEENFSASILAEVEELIASYGSHTRFTILKSKTTFLQGAKDTSDLFERGESIEDMKPIDVFDKLLESQDFASEQSEHLKSLFLELLESTYQND